MEEYKFPNGFTSWYETHHEVVSFLTLEYERDSVTSKVAEFLERNGTGGMYELAEELTNKFESLHEGREWDGEFFEELEYFLTKELNKL